jgi:hypothetical protein
MVDAFSVTKKKAAAVAYKEKEKGRDVSTTEAVQVRRTPELQTGRLQPSVPSRHRSWASCRP